MLGASNFYMPIFEEALETYQLPFLNLNTWPVHRVGTEPYGCIQSRRIRLWHHD